MFKRWVSKVKFQIMTLKQPWYSTSRCSTVPGCVRGRHITAPHLLSHPSAASPLKPFPLHPHNQYRMLIDLFPFYLAWFHRPKFFSPSPFWMNSAARHFPCLSSSLHLFVCIDGVLRRCKYSSLRIRSWQILYTSFADVFYQSYAINTHVHIICRLVRGIYISFYLWFNTIFEGPKTVEIFRWYLRKLI